MKITNALKATDNHHLDFSCLIAQNSSPDDPEDMFQKVRFFQTLTPPREKEERVPHTSSELARIFIKDEPHPTSSV
ncbi:hypothetical protein Ddc_08108 [Ditylenchus destructor]|nr:hypothetical protein Ddc_08108 [Ditylenchus destructor]